MTSDIKDRIAKLLVLAGSPNENEAKATLLKARALMAQHKLRQEECQKAENVKVINAEIGVTCSKTKYTWTINLAAVIAENYCCKAAFSKNFYGRTYYISIIGLEDDFEICKRIFLYAYDCCKTRCDQIFKQNDAIYTMQHRRSLSEAYGHGFVEGVQEALNRQTQKNKQELGLVLVVPKAVHDAIADMPHEKKRSKKSSVIILMSHTSRLLATMRAKNSIQVIELRTRHLTNKLF